PAPLRLVAPPPAQRPQRPGALAQGADGSQVRARTRRKRRRALTGRAHRRPARTDQRPADRPRGSLLALPDPRHDQTRPHRPLRQRPERLRHLLPPTPRPPPRQPRGAALRRGELPPAPPRT